MSFLWASSIQILHNLSDQLKQISKPYFYQVKTYFSRMKNSNWKSVCKILPGFLWDIKNFKQ